jgi:NifU-like protein involved in Fe-S cluster formation
MASDAVRARVRNPRRVGSFPADAPGVGTGEAGALDEGTVARIQVRVNGDRVAEARFRVFGCSAAIASASLIAELLEGTAIGEGAAIDADRLVRELELPEERRGVADVVVKAAQAALDDWMRKHDAVGEPVVPRGS